MTNEELDRARVDEALRIWDGSKGSLAVSVAIHAARLAREGWTPPVAVDPDLAEAKKMALDWMEDALSFVEDLALAGIKRGRELERIASGNYAIITKPKGVA